MQTTSTWDVCASRLTVEVEEVIVLVAMLPGVSGGSHRAHVVLQASARLLDPGLARVPVDVQGRPTRRARGVLLQPGAQTGAGNTML